VVGVDDVVGEVRVCGRVALLTGLHPAFGADVGGRIVGLGNVVVAVAVVARRDVLAAQGDRLSVEGVAIARELLFVTLAAHAVPLQAEFRTGGQVGHV
jgi:hypothetical protein